MRKNRNYVATECTAQTGVNSRKRRNTYINSKNESILFLNEKQSQSYKNQNTEDVKREIETRWVKKPTSERNFKNRGKKKKKTNRNKVRHIISTVSCLKILA